VKKTPAIIWCIVLFSFFTLLPTRAAARVVEYELVIAENEVNYTGRPVKAMTVNGGIPGPTLRFAVGDTARILVRNQMEVTTSIHWHGVLVPPGMDGVPNVSFPPIAPGTTFTYEFPIRHAGTYWYHSHSGLQEQRGVYGSLVLEPQEELYPADRDEVVLFSDWTDEDPHTVLRTLKRGSEWYALEKGSAQSIFGAMRAGRSGDYWSRELSRMPAMDIADVAYDRFLANGEPSTLVEAAPGEVVRMRLINGSATTYFHLQFAGGPMNIVSADGQDVEPVKKDLFLIGVAETYDVLVTVPVTDAWELRATAHDGSGYASAWIGAGTRHPAPDLPRPNLYHSMMPVTLSRIFALTPAGSMGMPDRQVDAGRFDAPGMNMEMSMKMDGASGMMDMGDMQGLADGGEMAAPADMAGTETMAEMPEMADSDEMTGMRRGDDMSTASQSEPLVPMDGTSPDMAMSGMAEPMKPVPGLMTPEGRMYGVSFSYMAADVSSSPGLAIDGMDPGRPGTPYGELKAVGSTALPLDTPVKEIRLTLDGDMERYVWFLNKKALSETDHILIKKGESIRFIMVNRTMMHHPMHLHGHFFRVINGQGERSPLKHTVDVAPMSTTVIEFAADEFGDWFFHCHLLYHMKSGMARLIHYDGYDPGSAVNSVRSRLYHDSWYFWGEADLLGNMTEGALTAANTRNILMLEWEAGWQNVDNMEREAVLTWDRYLNRFASVFLGAYFQEEGPGDDASGIAGIRYLLPLNIESSSWIDDDGGGRIAIEKEFMLTPRLSFFGELEYDSHDGHEGNGGFSFLLSKGASFLVQRHSEFEWGAGVQLRF
jgi:CopA family copper-resistance protein